MLSAEVQPPKNPFFTNEFIWSLTSSGKQFKVVIPAPGGVIDPLDAEEILEILELIQKRLKRTIEKGNS